MSIQDIMFKGIKQMYIDKEAFIQLHILPPPRWMPYFIWKWLIKHMIIISEFIHTGTEK
jgi:hypothetical protein